MSEFEKHRPWALIPAYQPDEKLLSLVEQLENSLAFECIIVVNDGSSPDKNQIFFILQEKKSIIVLNHDVNQGKGQALKTGLSYYLDKASLNSPGIVTCDADGQHLVEDIINVSSQGSREGTVTLGVRSFGTGTPFRSKLGNTFTSLIFSLFTGYYLKDTQTGLRFIPRDKVNFFIQIPYSRFDYEFAALVKLVSDFPGQLSQKPIETVYLDGNASSHFRLIKDSITIGQVFFRFSFLSICSAFLDYCVFILIFYLTNNILKSFICARIISVIFNFIFSRKLVFKAKYNFIKQFCKYICLVFVFMSISWAVTELFFRYFGGYVILAKILAEGSLFILSFVIQKLFIFKTKNVSDTNIN
jgi:putative flippase GtrA